MKIVELTETDVNSILKRNNYIMEYVNFQNNSINGVGYKKNKKIFFKIMQRDRCIQEIRGYEEIKKQYVVPELIEFLKHYDIGILVYEYDITIKKNQGLLHDFILECEEKNEYAKDVINNIFKYYDNSLKEIKQVSTYPMQEFYDKRVKTRLTEWYENWKVSEYKIIINKKIIITLKEIINLEKKFFKSKKRYLAFFSQGDPNTVNIGIKPIFMDLTTAGCNYIGAEIAAFIWSELIADVYFCPKYHRKSYKNHEKILKLYKRYEPNLTYLIDNKNRIININGKLKTSKVRKEILCQYLNVFKNNNVKISNELKYYIIMRILCIFNIREMEELDIMYSFLCVGIIYNLLEEDTNALDIIETTLLEEYTEEV